MPVYEYRCLECEQTFDIMQRITEPALTECKNCNGKLEKLISRSSFHLKGTGWYITDYARKNSPTESGKNKNSNESKDESTTKNETTEKKTEKKDKTVKSDSKSNKSEKNAS